MSKEALQKRFENMNFQDWTIVDFDDHLKGNPHV